jgi:hypothetical protein
VDQELSPPVTAAIEPTVSPPPLAVGPGRAPAAEQQAHFHFSLASLLLIVTLCSVILGAATIAPGLGVALAVLATPPLVHTCVMATRRRRRGRPMDAVEKTVLFAASTGAVVAILVGAGIAFYGTCWVGFFAGAAAGEGLGHRGYDSLFLGLGAGVILGAVVGIVVAVLLIVLFVRLFRKSMRR